MKVRKIFLLLVSIIFSIQAASVSSQETNTDSKIKPRIAVKKLIVNDPEDIQLEIISERVTDSTRLVLKFMNQYELVDTEDSDLSSLDERGKSFLEYCNKNNIDNIVYGKTYIGSDDSFVIEMSVFSREKEQTALTRIGRAETALDIFSAADTLTASIIEEFSGVHIAFGKIHLNNTGVKGSFIPFIDGEPFSPDALTIDSLLIGKRTVEIRQMRMLEETVIFSEEVIVKENNISELSFEIPHLLPEESKIIRDHDKIIKKNWDKLKWKQKTTKSFNELETVLSDTPYNTSLADLRDDYRKMRTEWEANLAEFGKREKREIIVGASMGATLGMIRSESNDDEGKESSSYNPIDEKKWNDEIHPSLSFGVNLQYQIFNNFYIQTELNYKEISFYDFEGTENYIRIIEIPVLFKLVKQMDIHRFAMYMGPSFYSVEKRTGIFDEDVTPGLFNHISTGDDNEVGMIMGLEYGIKKGRHILTAGLRYTNLNLLDYSFYDVDDDEVYDMRLDASIPEIILGYGYNLGGSGRIEKEKNINKWLFPAEAGVMFMLDSSDDDAMFFAGGGFLRKFTKNIYAGIRGFGFREGALPMLSLAYTKDPDKIIHNYSASLFPVMGMIVGAFEYNIGINRFNLGALIGGPLDNGLQNLALGIGVGYYF